jgi:hypothetical protein
MPLYCGDDPACGDGSVGGDRSRVASRDGLTGRGYWYPELAGLRLTVDFWECVDSCLSL